MPDQDSLAAIAALEEFMTTIKNDFNRFKPNSNRQHELFAISEKLERLRAIRVQFSTESKSQTHRRVRWLVERISDSYGCTQSVDSVNFFTKIWADSIGVISPASAGEMICYFRLLNHDFLLLFNALRRYLSLCSPVINHGA